MWPSTLKDVGSTLAVGHPTRNYFWFAEFAIEAPGVMRVAAQRGNATCYTRAQQPLISAADRADSPVRRSFCRKCSFNLRSGETYIIYLAMSASRSAGLRDINVVGLVHCAHERLRLLRCAGEAEICRNGRLQPTYFRRPCLATAEHILIRGCKCSTSSNRLAHHCHQPLRAQRDT